MVATGFGQPVSIEPAGRSVLLSIFGLTIPAGLVESSEETSAFRARMAWLAGSAKVRAMLSWMEKAMVKERGARASRGEAGGGRIPLEPRGGFRLLVVDDEPMLREILKDGFENMGYRVVAAESGMVALEFLQQDPDGFDLVILDMNMPGWDGLDTLRRLREVREDIPALLTTGYAEEYKVRAFERAGRVAVVQKPFRLDRLETALRGLLADSPRGGWKGTPS